MSFQKITYGDIAIQQQIETWAKDSNLDFDPEEHISMLIEDKFGITTATIVSAQPGKGFIVLTIMADIWREPREFALLKEGGLAW